MVGTVSRLAWVEGRREGQSRRPPGPYGVWGATRQFSLTDEEITAILRALRVRINDLHRLADNREPSNDPGDLRKQAIDLSILHDQLAAAS